MSLIFLSSLAFITLLPRSIYPMKKHGDKESQRTPLITKKKLSTEEIYALYITLKTKQEKLVYKIGGIT